MTKRHAGRDGEGGAVLIITAVLLVAVIGTVAILIDLGQVRSSVRIDQKVADLAALAAGKGVARGDPASACQAAIQSLNTNAHLSPAISSTSFCAQAGNDVTKTTCTGGTLVQATPTATVGSYTVSVHYPVPATEIVDANVSGGAHLNDGIPCQRLRVMISSSDGRIFGGIFGGSSLGGVRSATVRPSVGQSTQTPALWLLDPTGCTALSVGGGSQLTVGTTSPLVEGVITVDSDGTTCSSNQDTISASGAGTFVRAVPTTGAQTGLV